ncbi:MAG: hypothetical protein L6R43_07735 [Planctomycetes bacterium]|nr:hypothetical protein [Planctomycetota bacterium]
MSGPDLSWVLPLSIAASGVAAYFVGAAGGAGSGRRVGAVAALLLFAAGALLLATGLAGGSLELGPLLLRDVSRLGLLLGLLATVLGGLACLHSMDSVPGGGPVHLYHPLLLFASAGVVAVGLARDLFTLFVMVELSAIPCYALTAWRHREDREALPAAMNYLLQGVAGTVTALLGAALLYLQAGTLDLARLPAALRDADPSAAALAAALILAGYGVKIAVVPLHTWLPDAYSRAPAPVTAVMAGSTKAGVLVALFLCLSAMPAGTGAGAPAHRLGGLLCLVALVTMTAGNLAALRQTEVRRVLAWSAVAQMGYVLVGFGVGMRSGLAEGFQAGLFYALAYSIMKAGAFLAGDLLASSAGSGDVAALRGAGARHPVVGLSFALLVLGLVGVPATAGFPGKLLLLRAGMATGDAGGVLMALALAANAALSLAYYGPLLTAALFPGKDAPPGRGPAPPPLATFSVAVLAAATVLLGLFPGAVEGWFGPASRVFLPGGAP